MSRMLADLLGVHTENFMTDVNRLERASGLPSNDIRLNAEIIGKVQLKTRELGLDPGDTTGRELYHALIGLAASHDAFLASKLGGKDPADVNDLLPRLRKAALATKLPKTTWALKASVAKRLLKQCPPKHVMKLLGYKSVDSMLKREPVGELYGALQFAETREWQEQFIRKYKALTSMDFETRPVDIILLSKEKWGAAASEFVAKQRHIITHVREMGIILVLPPPFDRRTGITITVLPQLIHHINEMRLYSSFYKLHQMRSDLGAIIARSLLHDRGNHLTLAGHKVHWRVAQRHFGRKGYHPEILEPHVQPDDLSWRKAEEALYQIEPALHFWYDYDYVGVMKDGQPLSFNLMDVAINYVNNLPYEQRVFSHLQDALWNELFVRYMGEPALEEQVLKQLDRDASAHELLAQASREGK